ncbi:hypothetical protein HDU99_001021 [Rhizoclosmatium hyalinum]|nr:hypothetical protein HDU99_001021 [Rhizoclosmatium hyalinum]
MFSRAVFSVAGKRSISTAAVRPFVLPAMRRQAGSVPVFVHTQKRTLLRRTSDPIKDWAVPNVQQTVLQLLFEYAEGVAEDKITLDASIQNTLLVDRQDRFGLQWELCEIFQIYIDTARLHNRDFASGREAAEWISAVLEEQGRLVV